MFDVAVIGAGVVGALIARELSKYMLSVCLIEKKNDVAMGASKANSGIVHAGYDAVPGTLKASLNVRGAAMMQALAEELEVPYRQNGSLVIAFSETEMETIQSLMDRGRENGVSRMELLSRAEIQRREPELTSQLVGGLYAPGAIICPYKLCIAAVGNAMDNGVTLKTGFEVESIACREDGYEINSQKEAVLSRYVINAAGVGSDEIAAMAGDHSFKIYPRRGEYMILDKEFGGLVRHTIFRVPTEKGKGILVSPTVDGNLILGPTSLPTGNKTDTATTEELQEVWENALECVPGLPTGKVITSFVGLRAAADSGDFIINRPFPRFINAAGIESPGLTSSPAIALYVLALLREAGLEISPRHEYTPKRKKHTAPKSKYHKIVCRCESVSEGEILEAVHTNPPAHDVDGIKRRVRAGMGRCQGGFCLPHVAEILAEEQKLLLSEITKSGGASYLLNREVTDENS